MGRCPKYTVTYRYTLVTEGMKVPAKGATRWSQSKVAPRIASLFVLDRVRTSVRGFCLFGGSNDETDQTMAYVKDAIK